MNLDRVTSYGLKNSNGTPKGVSKAGERPSDVSNSSIHDNFERKNSGFGETAIPEEVRAFAKEAPDLREQKIAEIRDRIVTGFYESDGFIDELAGLLTA